MQFFPPKTYPGSLQAANLPVESCRTLQSCNTKHFHLLYSQIIIIIFLSVSRVISMNQGTTLLLFPTHATIAVAVTHVA